MTDGKIFSVGEKVVIHGFWGMNILVKEFPIDATLYVTREYLLPKKTLKDIMRWVFNIHQGSF